jgi:HEAT repeat protein
MERRFFSWTLALSLLVLWSARAAGEDTTAGDEDLLVSAGIATDGPGLLEFFRVRSLPAAERRALLEKLVRQLGSKKYKERKHAAAELVGHGQAALEPLKAALTHADLEVRSRAQACLNKIDKGTGANIPAAAARLLTARRPEGALAALLNYLPHAGEEWSQEESSSCLGRLALRGGKADPLLTAALKDKLPLRRAAAAYTLGRMGGPDQRALVRPLLGDAEALVRRWAVQGLIGGDGLTGEGSEADEDLLKSNQVETDAAGLAAFFRKRSLSDRDHQHLQDLVRQLGDRVYRKRKQATEELVRLGTAAMRYLEPAQKDEDKEIAWRATACIARIQRGPGTGLPIAAARVLVKRAPGDAVKVLLTYAPSADDDDVEEAVLAGLSALAVRDVKLDLALTAALHDASQARRGAAAFVLGRVGLAEDCRAVRKLLEDRDPRVRFRAAQGLVHAKDKAAVPVLLDLLDLEKEDGLRVKAEEFLRQLALDQSPSRSVTEPSAEDRKKALAAWKNWWQSHGAKVNLGVLHQDGGQLGLTVICEFDSTRTGSGQAWEFGRDFKPRWKLVGLQGPMDAHLLHGNKVLIAEYYGNRITERDLKGNILWEHKVATSPIACQRLPNGNTFISTYTHLSEVTRDHKEVYSVNRGQDGQIYSAQKVRNGHIVYITHRGKVVEFDPRRGKVLSSFTVGFPGAWCGVEWLPNGRYLVTLMGTGKIMEMDRSGKSHWQTTVTGAHQTLRLPNGHTLVVCMNNKRLVEVDRAGKMIWERAMEGRPWRVHRR